MSSAERPAHYSFWIGKSPKRKLCKYPIDISTIEFPFDFGIVQSFSMTKYSIHVNFHSNVMLFVLGKQ